MRAGILKHIITIQTPTRADDGMGGKTTTWTTLATVRAAIWPLKGTEAVEARKETGTITHRIRIRYLAGITAGCRVAFGSRTFELVAPPINMDERNRELELLAEEKT